MTYTMKHLFLVGYMGCGKSTLGRKLARRLEMEFADTDVLIEQQEGATVADLFQYEGEERFRELEYGVLNQLIVNDAVTVISTGGGLPVWKDNMERMNDSGVTVFLHRSAEQIVHRLSPYGRQKRPRLRGLNDQELLAFMMHDMEVREAFYSQATLTIECDGISDDEVVGQIVEYMTKING